MKKAVRITLEIVLPPALGASTVIMSTLAFEGRIPLNAILYILGVAYLFAVIPSVAYTTVMEVAFSRGISPNSWSAVSLSAFSGTVAGLMIGLFFPQGANGRAGAIFSMTAIGFIAGAVTGLLVKRISRATNQTA